MAKVNMTIKKELSEEEFERLLNAFKEELHNNADPDFLAHCLEIYIKELTPAEAVHVLYVKSDNQLETKHEDKPITIELSGTKGIIKQCLQSKEAHIANDVQRDPYYTESIDNVFSYEVKNLLVMPLYDISQNIFALVWAAIPKGNINQFITKDIEHLTTLINLISYTPPRAEKRKERVKEEKKAPSEKTADTDSSVSEPSQPQTKKPVEAPALIKKIKSIFSKSGK